MRALLTVQPRPVGPGARRGCRNRTEFRVFHHYVHRAQHQKIPLDLGWGVSPLECHFLCDCSEGRACLPGVTAAADAADQGLALGRSIRGLALMLFLSVLLVFRDIGLRSPFLQRGITVALWLALSGAFVAVACLASSSFSSRFVFSGAR